MSDNRIRFILDDKTPVLFEKVIKSQFSKPVDYYGTLDEAIKVLKSQGYGIVEIPPLVNKGQMSYVYARVDSDENLILNLVTYGWKKPEGEDARPFTIEGNRVWLQGDTIYNTDYIINKVRGWVCIEEGIPGVWETFGQLGYVTDSSEGAISTSTSISSSLVCYENELPSAGKSKLGKLILFAEDSSSDYDVYYCNRGIDSEGLIFYSWNSLSQGDSNYLKSIELEEENGIWLITKLRNYLVTDDLIFREKVKNPSILVGRIPGNSLGNQRVKIGDNEYLLKYDNESVIEENDFTDDSIIAIKFNPNIDYSNQDYLFVANIPVEYYLRKFSDLSFRITQNISDLTSLLNSKVSELSANISSVNSTLTNNISSVNSNLSDSIHSLSENLSEIQFDLNSSIDRVQSDLNIFKSTINESLLDKEEELSGKITSTKVELEGDISSASSTLLSKINSTNEELLFEIQKVSNKLNDLIDNKISLNGASVEGNLSVTGVITSKELIFPTESGSEEGSVWLNSI